MPIRSYDDPKPLIRSGAKIERQTLHEMITKIRQESYHCQMTGCNVWASRTILVPSLSDKNMKPKMTDKGRLMLRSTVDRPVTEWHTYRVCKACGEAETVKGEAYYVGDEIKHAEAVATYKDMPEDDRPAVRAGEIKVVGTSMEDAWGPLRGETQVDD